MKCLLCGSSNIQMIDTVVSDFVMARIAPDFSMGGGQNYKTKLCFCRDCTFAFYDYRMTTEEDQKLYQGYRGEEYQRTREKYECWYTKKVNDALNRDHKSLETQRRGIESIVFQNINREIEFALDYGGNEGRTFTPRLGTKGKYVYDISGIPPVEGVQSITHFEELKKYSFDFIMCNHLFEHLIDPLEVMRNLREIGRKGTVYYIEVPSENPFLRRNKFSIGRNLKLLLNPIYSPIRLIRYYLQQRRGPYMPMKEHINFYTKESIRGMVEREGFQVLDVQENVEKGVLGDLTVLSILFKQDG